MAISYDIRVTDAFGEELCAANDFETLDCSLKENEIGAVTLTVPPTYPISYYKKDGRLLISRSTDGSLPALIGNTHWFIRRVRKTITRGKRGYTITALHANCLLKRRIVAYNAGTAYTEKNDFADDIIKEVIRENFGSLATDTSRRWASTLLSIQADTGQGPTVAKAFTRRNVMDVCQEVAQTAADMGTYVGFEIIALGATQLEFRTYIGQRGVDHTSDSNQPVYLPLDNITVDDDWSNEVTYVYAGGLGVGANRAIGTASDTTLINESPFGRIEYFWDGRQTENTTLLNDDARALLRANRPRRIITGDVVDTEGVRFGVHYNYGDLVSINVDGEVRDIRVDTVGLSYTRNTGERLALRIRSET